MAMVLSLTSPNGTYDSVFLKNYADIYLVDKIKRVPGVGDLNVFGSDYSMRIWINPDKLAELGLTVADVVSAVKNKTLKLQLVQLVNCQHHVIKNSNILVKFKVV